MNRKQRRATGGPTKPATETHLATERIALLLSEALVHEQAGRLAEMERCVRAALSLAPDHPDSLFALARLGMRAGHFQAAQELADRALAGNAASPPLHRLRGQALANLGRDDEARQSLARALELAPGWSEAAFDLGQLLYRAERLDDMLTVLRPLDHAEAQVLCGQALMVLGRLDEAAECFAAALTRQPNHAEAIAGLASIHVEQDRPLEALALAEGLTHAPGRLHYLRAVALGMLGREAEAEAEAAGLRANLLAGLARRGNLPTEVYVQLSRRCNLRCTMCGHEIWKDNSGFMEQPVFDRVLAECEATGIGKMTILAAQGEPFLHPRAFEMMEGAVAKGMALSVVTNGTPFTAEKIERLARLGLESIQFSFAGWDKDSYESVYVGAKFDRAVTTLQAMNVALKPTRTTFIVKAVAPDNSEDYVTRTRAFLASLGIDRVNTVAPNNFGGTVQIGRHWDKAGLWSYRNLDKHRRTVCRILMRAVGVYVDGSVTACGCYDANAQLRIGDIMAESLSDIRNGARFTSILEAFRSGDVSAVPMCAKCDDPFG
jgi:MoaA/NifB/PqqE/SkfB family radical SAM enzyme/Flp pilus assembly protein TadD